MRLIHDMDRTISRQSSFICGNYEPRKAAVFATKRFTHNSIRPGSLMKAFISASTSVKVGTSGMSQQQTDRDSLVGCPRDKEQVPIYVPADHLEDLRAYFNQQVT